MNFNFKEFKRFEKQIILKKIGAWSEIEKNAQKIEKTTVEKQVTKSTEKIISSAFVFPKKKPIT